MSSRQADLFPEPPPPKPPGPEPGELRGDLEALEAAARGVEVWCGPRMGWRPFGPLIRPQVVVVVQHGRAMSGPTFTLGPVEFPDEPDEPAPEPAEDEVEAAPA